MIRKVSWVVFYPVKSRILMFKPFPDASDAHTSSTLKKTALCLDNLPTQDTLDTKNLQSPCSLTTPDPNKVGQSVFYDCIDASPGVEVAGASKVKPRNDTDEEGESKFY